MLIICLFAGQEIELTMHDGTVRDLCFLEDTSNKSSLLISGGAGDCKIYVTDCATGTPFQALSGHSGRYGGMYNVGPQGCTPALKSQFVKVQIFLKCIKENWPELSSGRDLLLRSSCNQDLFFVCRTRVDVVQLGWCHVCQRLSRQDCSVLGPSNSWLCEYGDSSNCTWQSGWCHSNGVGCITAQLFIVLCIGLLC